ncbi:MAG: GIY-YIG nuclease family protein [Oscillospiraceae bacterium]|jgi:putative endonuclease
MGWFVYIVRCADDTLYTGVSTDVDRRTQAHNAGHGAKYTRSRTPVTVVYRAPCESRSAALSREAAIKKLSRAEKLALIDGQGET